MFEWFQNKEFALAMALTAAVSRFGSVANNVLSPTIANATNVSTALWCGALVSGISLACMLALYPVKRAAAARAQATLLAELSLDFAMVPVPTRRVDSGPVSANPRASFWLLTLCYVLVYCCVDPFMIGVASPLLMERDFFKQQGELCALTNTSACQSVLNPPNSHCEVGDSWQPPLPYFIDPNDVDCTDKAWKASCAHDYCQSELHGIKNSNSATSIPYFMSAFLTPFLGKMSFYVRLNAVAVRVNCKVWKIWSKGSTLIRNTSITPDP